MNFASINISAVLPAVVLSVFGIIVMVAEPFVSEPKKDRLGWLAFAGTIVGMLALVPMAANRGQWYSNLWIVDDYDVFLNFVFLLIAAITILTSIDFLRREDMNHPVTAPILAELEDRPVVRAWADAGPSSAVECAIAAFDESALGQ